MYRDYAQTLRCWSCRAPLEADAIRRDGVLVPRAGEEGGPYWSYRCPACRVDMHCEQNLFRKLLVTPPPIFPLFDALVSFFDEAQWRDYQTRRRWFEERPGLRDWFFGPYEDQLAEEAAREAGRRARERDEAADRAGRTGRAQTKRGRGRAAGADGSGRQETGRQRARDNAGANHDSRAESRGEEHREGPPRRRVEVDRPAAPHEVLGVEANATADDLTHAYRDLAKKYHPDRFDHLDEEFRQLAHRRFLEIRAAYDALQTRARA